MTDWDAFLGSNNTPPASPTKAPATDWDTFLGGETKPVISGASPRTSSLPSYMRWPLGLASAGVAGLAAGAGLPGDLEQLGTRYIANPISRAFGLQQDPIDQQHTLFPTSSTMLDLTKNLGLTGQSALAPQGEIERLAQAGVAGIGSTVIPTLASGGVLTLPLALAGGTGGMASQGAADLGLPPEAQLAAGVAFGIPGYGIGALLSGRSLESIAAGLGKSTNLDEAGSVLRSEAQQFRDSMTASGGPIDVAEAAMNSKVPPTATGDHSNLVGSLALLKSEGGEPALEANNFLTRLSKGGGRLGQTAKNIQRYFEDVDKYNTLGGSVPLIPEVSWPAQRQFRSAIGDWMAKTPSETTAKKLLYSSATDDLGNIATSNGAAEEFQNFNQVSRQMHSLNDGPIDTILSAPSGAEAARQLLLGANRTGEHLEALRGVLPTGVDELAAAQLRLKALRALPASPSGAAALVPSEADRLALQGMQKPPGEPGIGTRMLESIGGGEILGRIGGLAAGGLGYNPKYGEYIGGLIGQGLPWAKNLLLNPRIPASGAVGTLGPMYMQPGQ